MVTAPEIKRTALNSCVMSSGSFTDENATRYALVILARLRLKVRSS